MTDDEDLLRVDRGGERAAERGFEFRGVAGADGIDDLVDRQRGVVGAERQDVVARQTLAARGDRARAFRARGG